MVPQRIDDDVVVELQYKLWSDGELVEESEADDPLIYLHGHDNIIPGLERELYGLSIGDEKEIIIGPEGGYGHRDPENVEEVGLDELPLGFRPEPGMLLEVQDEDGNVYVAQVQDVSEDTVTLDFNHPMAGKELRFQVRVTALREPTEEELEHGHVHDGSHHHH